MGPKPWNSLDALSDMFKIVLGVALLTGYWKSTFIMDTAEFDASGRTRMLLPLYSSAGGLCRRAWAR